MRPRASAPRRLGPTAALVAVLLLAACGTPGLYVPPGSSAPNGTPDGGLGDTGGLSGLPAPITQWEHVRAEMGPDGSVPLAMALQAWVVAIGSLPGVDEPAGEPSDDASIELAVRWILRHWDSLTDAQKETVTAFLDDEQAADAATGVVLAAAQSAPARAGRSGAVPVSDWISEAETAKEKIQAHLGRPLKAPIKVEFKVTPVKEGQIDFAFTISVNAAGQHHQGPMKTCLIWITPIGQGLGGADMVAVISHEVLHCYQYELTTVKEALLVADWVSEGPGAWAGEDIVANGDVFGGSVIPGNHFWRNWQLAPRQQLFTRAYDAIGFFAHLKDEGIDPWKLLDPMQKAAVTDSASAYELVTAQSNGDEAIDAWGPSLFRDPANAPVWDTRGPGLQYEVKTPVGKAAVSDGATLVDAIWPQAAFPLNLDLQAETVTFIARAARGKIRFSDGSVENLADILGRPICTLDHCECPEGSEGAAHDFVKGAPGVAMVGFTGHTDGIELTIQGYPLDLTCKLPPEDFQPPEDCMCPSIFDLGAALPLLAIGRRRRRRRTRRRPV